MEVVTITEASRLLEISRQRIWQLINAKRIKGAYKTQKGWKIPLYGKTRMPKIIRGQRGCKGKWLVTLLPTLIQ
ncbi:helix-turn-helix domain-containing protein [Crocosphaera sp. Alani8]|uniref:helix-turn-helix domain-containing protein n=1 Tax=Crocosphaera sp. Alani8 TaxID=3038952 RepID=UPI00313CBC64